MNGAALVRRARHARNCVGQFFHEGSRECLLHAFVLEHNSSPNLYSWYLPWTFNPLQLLVIKGRAGENALDFVVLQNREELPAARCVFPRMFEDRIV